MNQFVRVNSTDLAISGARHRVYGANCYYLGFASDAMVREVFDLSSAMRFNTLRTWAFWHGEPDWSRLDRTIAWAEQRGIRLILALVNYWADFGGMAEWSRRFGFDGQRPFYIEAAVRSAFAAHVEQLLLRENPLTGRRYRDEPAVLAWELANEPRCENCDPEIVLDWLAAFSALVKSCGAQQLVSAGDEGALDGEHGMNHDAILALPAIDFGTFHLYADDLADPAAHGIDSIRRHAEAARRAGKPTILEEYGSKNVASRSTLYARWRAEVDDAGVNGSLLWMIAGRNDDGSLYYDDGYTIYDANAVP